MGQAKGPGAQADSTAGRAEAVDDTGEVSLSYFPFLISYNMPSHLHEKKKSPSQAPNPNSTKGPNGPGPWGTSNYGPYSAWSTRSDWRSGPWTAWWDGTKCPPSDWPGWTAGPWSTSAPWTTWSGCTASTTATSVVTTTVSGVATTTTAYGLQVAQAAAESGSGTSGSTTETKGAGERVTVGMGVVIGAAVLGVAVGL